MNSDVACALYPTLGGARDSQWMIQQTEGRIGHHRFADWPVGGLSSHCWGLPAPDTRVLISHNEDMEAARQLHDVGGLRPEWPP